MKSEKLKRSPQKEAYDKTFPHCENPRQPQTNNDEDVINIKP